MQGLQLTEKLLLYWKRIDDNGVGSLYRYSVKEERAEKISSNAYNYKSSYYMSSLRWIWTNFYSSTDGRTVYYFEDVTKNIGTLKCATVGSEPVKIATDVLVEVPCSGIYGEVVNPSAFVFQKYVSVDDNENLRVNLMYYNGVETTTLAREVYDSFRK